jgi:hypothetical protein
LPWAGLPQAFGLKKRSRFAFSQVALKYLIVAILQKELKLSGILHQTLQVLTVHPSESVLLAELLTRGISENLESLDCKQGTLWDL